MELNGASRGVILAVLQTEPNETPLQANGGWEFIETRTACVLGRIIELLGFAKYGPGGWIVEPSFQSLGMEDDFWKHLSKVWVWMKDFENIFPKSGSGVWILKTSFQSLV